MKRHEQHDGSREGLLDAGTNIPLRPSLEQAYKSSSEFGEHLEDLDLLDENDQKYNKRGRWPWGRKNTRDNTYGHDRKATHERPSRMKRLGRCLWPRRTCLIITVILLGGFSVLVGGGGLWVYKSAPADGVCSPI